MEAFEQVVKVYLEANNYIVTSSVKFPVRKRFKRQDGTKVFQTHGYEVDLVAARYGALLLCSVKSYFGSAGVRRQGFKGIADRKKRCHFGRYTMFNDSKVRRGILKEASKRYGYPLDQIRIALFAGKFYPADESCIREHVRSIELAGGPIEIVGLSEIVSTLQGIAKQKTYINDAVVMTLKVLHAADLLVAETKTVMIDNRRLKSVGGDDDESD